MYEFTDKETRQKFKKTKSGKKTNKMFYTALPFGMIALITYLLITTNVIKLDELMYKFIFSIIFIIIVIMCYFDGKRDGAIEMFKSNIKK